MNKKKLVCSISVVIPIRNEERNIDYFIIPLYKFLKNNFKDFELVLVENGSTDKTAILVDRLAKKHKEIRALHLGYGSYGDAIVHGLREATRPYIIYTDADGPIELKEILNVNKLDNYDALLFYKIGKRESFTRAFYSFFYNWLIRLLFFNYIRDVNFSFKMFRKEVFDKLELGYGKSMWFVDVEMIVQLRKKNAKILWVPAKLIHRKVGKSSISGKAILGLLRDLFFYRLYTLFRR